MTYDVYNQFWTKKRYSLLLTVVFQNIFQNMYNKSVPPLHSCKIWPQLVARHFPTLLSEANKFSYKICVHAARNPRPLHSFALCLEPHRISSFSYLCLFFFLFFQRFIFSALPQAVLSRSLRQLRLYEPDRFESLEPILRAPSDPVLEEREAWALCNRPDRWERWSSSRLKPSKKTLVNAAWYRDGNTGNSSPAAVGSGQVSRQTVRGAIAGRFVWLISREITLREGRKKEEEV